MSACFVWHMTAIPRNKRPINENSVQNPLNRILDAPLFQSAILLVLVIALILVVLLLIVVLVIILIVLLILVVVLIIVLIVLVLIFVLLELHIISPFLSFGNSIA